MPLMTVEASSVGQSRDLAKRSTMSHQRSIPTKSRCPLLLSLALIAGLWGSGGTAQGQSSEERFQDLFSTAAYACAFGATLGAAALAFQPEPEKHLKFIAVGASLGFIGGSVLGSYVVFSPVFAGELPRRPATAHLSENQIPKSSDDYAITGLSARWKL